MRLFCLILTATLLTSSISSNDFIEVPNEYIEDAISKAEENFSSTLESLDDNSSGPESVEEIATLLVESDNSDIVDAINKTNKRIDSIILLLFILTFVPMLQKAVHKIMFKKGD